MHAGAMLPRCVVSEAHRGCKLQIGVHVRVLHLRCVSRTSRHRPYIIRRNAAGVMLALHASRAIFGSLLRIRCAETQRNVHACIGVSTGAPCMACITAFRNCACMQVGRTLHEATNSIPIIGDGDTGYGNAMNVKRTVRGYAAAGFAGTACPTDVEYQCRVPCWL